MVTGKIEWHPKKLTPKKELYEEGDPASAIYLCESGLVMESMLGPEDTQISVIVPPKSVFGIDALFSDTRTTSICVETEGEALWCDKNRFYEAMGGTPEITKSMISALAARNYRMVSEAINIGYSPASFRVALALSRLSEINPQGELSISRGALADLCCACKKTATRGISALIERGAIKKTADGGIEIVNKGKLFSDEEKNAFDHYHGQEQRFREIERRLYDAAKRI